MTSTRHEFAAMNHNTHNRSRTNRAPPKSERNFHEKVGVGVEWQPCTEPKMAKWQTQTVQVMNREN